MPVKTNTDSPPMTTMTQTQPTQEEPMEKPVSMLYGHVVATIPDQPLTRQIELCRALRESVFADDLRDLLDHHIRNLRATKETQERITRAFDPR